VPVATVDISCLDVDILSEAVSVVIPASYKLALALFRGIYVVPTYKVEFPSTPLGIVPLSLD